MFHGLCTREGGFVSDEIAKRVPNAYANKSFGLFIGGKCAWRLYWRCW